MDWNGKGLGGKEESNMTPRLLGEQPRDDCTI